MANKIQIRRGQIGNLPTLDEGEFGFAIDVERLYIGNPLGSGNILMNIGGAGFDLGNGADGYVSFFTGQNAIAGDNDFFWDREFNRLGLRTDIPTHTLTVDGYITPATDNIHRLGTYDQRWEAIHLGPNSLHISSTAEETGQSFDWRFGIDQTTGNNGNFILVQGTEHFMAVDPIESIISFYADEVTVGGNIKLPEITAPLNEAGYGKIYISSVDGNIHFVDAGGTDVNLVDNITDTVDEHYRQHSDAIQTIRKELDGYASEQTEHEHYNQHSEVFKTILKDLDGYALTSHTHADFASDTTVSEHYKQHSETFKTILKDLDGYGAGSGDASDVTVSEHYKQHSETFKTILKELDGYSGGGGDITGLEQTVDDHYQEHSDALDSILKDLDGYTSVSGSAYGDGYVLFFTGEGSVAGDNDLFWDRVNNRLGIGTYQPQATLDVSGTIKTQALQVEGSGAADGYVFTSDIDGYGTWKDPALAFHRLIVNEDGTLVLDAEGNPTFTVS